MLRVAALTGRLLIFAVLVALAVSEPETTAAQGQPAVVEGTTQLFIRRGPGREFPPFATLTGGSKVEVQEQRGTWARVSTASGQVGYVHTKFLRLLDTASTPAATAAQAAESPAPSTETAPPSQTPATSQPTPTRRSPTLTAVAHHESSPTIETPEGSTPTPTGTAKSAAPPRPVVRDMQSEVERLSNAVEALNSRLDQRFPLPEDMSATVVDSGSSVSGGAILLLVLGLIFGWFMGATYQRNKDRGRRSRIRL